MVCKALISTRTLQEKLDKHALPIRAYLEQSVVPVLLQGLSAVVKERWVCLLNLDLYG